MKNHCGVPFAERVGLGGEPSRLAAASTSAGRRAQALLPGWGFSFAASVIPIEGRIVQDFDLEGMGGPPPSVITPRLIAQAWILCDPEKNPTQANEAWVGHPPAASLRSLNIVIPTAGFSLSGGTCCPPLRPSKLLSVESRTRIAHARARRAPQS